SIQEAKSQSDFVLVIVHGGHEYYNLPSLRMQKQYRFYIDNGADLVVGHHSHCISGMETYKNKKIYYSLGNFLFTKPSVFKGWYNGLILEVIISKDKEISVTHKFVEQSKVDYGLSFVQDRERSFEEYSSIIIDETQLFNQWEKYTVEMRQM